jgi:dihydroneopterin aldolase
MSFSSPDSSQGGPARGADRIEVPAIRAHCVLGVRPRERRRRRPVEITIVIEADLEAAAAADALDLTVDYSKVVRRVRELVAATEFRLVEALARHVAAAVLDFPGVRAVEVTVSKPRALRGAGAPQVTMRREKA